MTERFPGYDVLSKREGLSWNDVTRRAIDARLAVRRTPRFFEAAEWRTLEAVCERIVPQTGDADPVPLPAYVDEKCAEGRGDGYRYENMPHVGACWRQGLAALDEVARREHGRDFHALDGAGQDALLQAMQRGDFQAEALRGMSAKTFFMARVIADVALMFYAHPSSWSEIGWAGPASPRGYVRLRQGRRDAWEPVSEREAGADRARRKNANVR